MTQFSRTFSTADQSSFAAWSGDRNPIHLDGEWAAAHFPGTVVVHGMHVLLWALDAGLRNTGQRRLAGVRATFVSPVLIGDVVEAALVDGGERLSISVAGTPVVLSRLTFAGEPRADRTSVPHAAGDQRDGPASPTSLAGLRGCVASTPQAHVLVRAFPQLTANVGEAPLLGLAAVSTLVGMHCPGLHGVLTDVDVTLGADGESSLAFEVQRYSEPLRCVSMSVRGLGLRGRVQALIGRTCEPPSDDVIATSVRPREFESAHPLVVGAGSGLGAVTARLLAAGGARPVLTWHRRAETLDDVTRSIAALGGQFDAVPLDVTHPRGGLAQLTAIGWPGQQVYYFATPRIFRRRQRFYCESDFRAFLDIYVDGFLAVIHGLLEARPTVPLHAFYPSSVALDESSEELLEYAMAKSAGEQACARLAAKYEALRLTVKRLPRTRTRQTATLLNVRAQPPDEVMLPIIRAVQAEESPAQRG